MPTAAIPELVNGDNGNNEQKRHLPKTQQALNPTTEDTMRKGRFPSQRLQRRAVIAATAEAMSSPEAQRECHPCHNGPTTETLPRVGSVSTRGRRQANDATEEIP